MVQDYPPILAESNPGDRESINELGQRLGQRIKVKEMDQVKDRCASKRFPCDWTRASSSKINGGNH